MIFVDTNVLLDLLEEGTTVEARWSHATVRRVAQSEHMVTNLVVAAEIAGQVVGPDALGATLRSTDVDLVDLDLAAAHRAGAAFREYRRRGGAREAIIADFLIAAHAVTLGATLLTRDRRIASYFPDLSLMTPETDHG